MGWVVALLVECALMRLQSLGPVVALLARTWQVVLAAACIVVVVVSAFVAIVWASGGLDTRGATIDWGAVSALSAVAATTATILAVGALGMAATELEERARDSRRQAETERVARSPYLRVDVGLLHRPAAGFFPPKVEYIFNASDFDVEHSLAVFTPIWPAPPPGGESLGPLVLWVTNLQDRALGTAYKIRVNVLVAWDETDPAKAAQANIEFTYLAPGQTTAFRLTDVRDDLPWLLAKVTEISYEDLFGAERLPEAHGALTMLYDQDKGVRNGRSFQLSR